MVHVRRLSSKKTRFSCKKLAYSEICRYQHLEYSRALTRRKRMERVLFLPEVKAEVNALSSESVQRILCQGSPFHFSKALVKDDPETLHSKLFDDLFPVKKLGQYDLVLLISLLQKLSVLNLPLLSKALEECLTRFPRMTLGEVAHISLITETLPEGLQQTFVPRWIAKLVSLIRRMDLASLSHADFSSIAKVIYAISHAPTQNTELVTALLSAIPSGEQYEERAFSRDCSLICRSMLKTGTVNYEFLKEASYFHQALLSRHVETLSCRLRDMSIMSKRNVIFSLKEPDENPINVSYILTILEASECFGYHNKDLMEIFSKYVDLSLESFIHNPRIADSYKEKNSKGGNQVTRKYLELLQSQRYRRISSGKNDLQLLLRDMLASLPRQSEDFWCIDDLFTIGSKYVSNRKLFATFLYFLCHNIGIDKMDIKSASTIKKLCWSYLNYNPKLLSYVSDTGCRYSDYIPNATPIEMTPASYNSTFPIASKGWFTHGQSFEELYHLYIKERKLEQLTGIKEAFEAMASRLPRISCWNGIWMMIHLIDTSRCTDMLPLVRSFLEEAFIGFYPIDKPIKQACSIASYMIKNLEASSCEVLYLDSCVRVVEILVESELSRDYGSLNVFCNVLELSISLKSLLEGGIIKSDDIHKQIEQLSSTLVKYLMDFSRNKEDLFLLPVAKEVYTQVLRSLYQCRQPSIELESMIPEEMVYLLLDGNGSKILPFVEANRDLIRHIVFYGYNKYNTSIKALSK